MKTGPIMTGVFAAQQPQPPEGQPGQAGHLGHDGSRRPVNASLAAAFASAEAAAAADFLQQPQQVQISTGVS